MADIDYQEALARALAQLTAAVTNTSLYSAAHPQVLQYVDRAYQLLADMLSDRQEITLLLIGSDLVVDNRPFTPQAAGSTASFVRILRKKAIERVTFCQGLPRPELQSFILELSAADGSAVRSTTCIRLGKVGLRVLKADEGAVSSSSDAGPADAVSLEGHEELMALSASELDALKDLYLSVKKHKKIDVRGVDDIVKTFIHGLRRDINPLGLLASLKSLHEYTFTHVTNVCILTMTQAESLGFQGEHLHQIGVASLLHDVGKVFIPEEVLAKPGKLNDQERKTIETHTVKGARYLMGLEGIPKVSVLAALEHHLKFNGTGYPSIRGGWTPNIVSQLISVADVFDAMRSKRSYQEAYSVDYIAGILRKGSGTSFNPVLVDHFLKLIGHQAA